MKTTLMTDMKKIIVMRRLRQRSTRISAKGWVREINSLDELSQNNNIDERVQAIADFVQETGRKPQDWFTYQSRTRPNGRCDSGTSSDGSGISKPIFEELNMLIESKYKLDPNVYEEKDVHLAASDED